MSGYDRKTRELLLTHDLEPTHLLCQVNPVNPVNCPTALLSNATSQIVHAVSVVVRGTLLFRYGQACPAQVLDGLAIPQKVQPQATNTTYTSAAIKRGDSEPQPNNHRGTLGHMYG